MTGRRRGGKGRERPGTGTGDRQLSGRQYGARRGMKIKFFASIMPRS